MTIGEGPDMAEGGNKTTFNTPEDVERAFYEAFKQCDADAMAALWAVGEVVCVHPGSGPIVGREAVVRSWSHIFNNARTPDLEVAVVRRTVSAKLAVHVVTEEFATGDSSALVVASNVYQKFDGSWLMIGHHGSAVHAQPMSRTIQ